MSRNSQRPELAAVIGVGLVLLGLAARCAIVSGNPAELTRLPMEDDSYYDQSYARQFWQGEFFTLDGVHRGNAYHPLYNLLCAPLHGLAGDDRVLAIRYACVFGIILFGVSLVIAHRLLRRVVGPGSSMPILGIGLYATTCTAFCADANLMQTGLQLLLIWLLAERMLWLWHLPSKSWTAYACLGAINTFLCLARIDSAALVFGYSLTLLVDRRAWELTWSRFLILVTPAALVTVAWLAISYVQVGSWLPTGGAANSTWQSPSAVAGNAARAASTLILMLTGLPHDTVQHVFWPEWFFTHPMKRPLVGLGLAIGFAALLARGARLGHEARADLVRLLRAWAPLLVGISVVVATYIVRYDASYFFGRYFSVLLPFLTVGWVWLIWQTLGTAHRWAQALALTLHVAIFICFQAKVLDTKSSGWWDALHVASSSFDEDAWIASPETGVLGYYHRRTINLDGKTNVDALRARREGRFASYVAQVEADWIVDRWGYLYTGDAPARSELFRSRWDLVREQPYLWRRKVDR